MEIEDFIDSVANQDFSKAAPTFNEIMQSKINDALEQEKISVADQIFNGVDPDDDEEQLEMDFDEEEIDDAIDDLDDEDLD